MITRWVKWAFALTTISIWIAAVAQVTTANLPAKQQTQTVSIPFFADDNHGSPVSGITQADLSILDNKKPPQSVVAIRTTKEMPLRLGVLIDTSNSERQSALYRPGTQAAFDFLNQVLNGAEDRAFIVGVATVANVSEFMNRDEVPRFEIDLTPRGATSLFDAIYVACNKRMQADPTHPARRVLVILSDGGDTQSHVNRDEAIAAAQKAGAVIFVVGTSENRNNLGNQTLEHLADKTGGRAFLDLSRKEIPKAFCAIREQVENMYEVTYVPADLGTPGQYHSIEVKATSDKKVKLHAPKGYYVTANESTGG